MTYTITRVFINAGLDHWEVLTADRVYFAYFCDASNAAEYAAKLESIGYQRSES